MGNALTLARKELLRDLDQTDDDPVPDLPIKHS
jgi:hypothetical protein